MTLDPAPLAETPPLSRSAFEQRRKDSTPFVMRRAAADWPSVRDAEPHALFRRLSALDTGELQGTLIGKPGTRGRFFYSEDYRGQNYDQHGESLTAGLDRLLGGPHPDGAYIQSIEIARHIPRFAQTHGLDIVPDGVSGRAWIGTPTTVQTHWDASENIAVCVLGRREVTLFPPACLSGLYPGPLESAPGRVLVSRVDLDAPDLDRFPRFADVAPHALRCVLEPGDAVYIPCGWWHRIRALDDLNMLVNYWWSDGEAMVDNHWAAVIMALAAFQHLPPASRDIWRAVFDHYVFARDGEPMADIDPSARGFLGGIPSGEKRWAIYELLSVLGPEVGLQPPPR